MTYAAEAPRSLDHFVDAVHDVDVAAARYEKLGFHVLPKMRHLEIGSCNRIVQLEGTYLELVGDLDRTPALLRDRLLPRFDCGEGLTMTSLTSSDLQADHRRLSAMPGLVVDRILNARRPIRMPDGTNDETDSHCFYVWNAHSKFLTLFLSEHYKPHTIWVPEYMRHPNGAIRIAGQVFVANAPLDQVDYFAMLLQTSPREATSECVRFITARHEFIDILTPNAAREQFGEAAPARLDHFRGMGIALRYEVADLASCRQLLETHLVRFTVDRDVLRVAAIQAAGIVTEFVQASGTGP